MRLIALGVIFLSFMISFCGANTDGTSEWNISVNESGHVTDFMQYDYSTAELDVVANVAATQYWAEILLNTSEVDFGTVEIGKSHNARYRIQARGTTDIIVTPTLKDVQDSVFSNLYLSRTTSSLEKIGTYSLVYNLSQNKRTWSVIGTGEVLKNVTNSSGSNGEQTMKLDLTNFRGIIPFDQPIRNTVKFVITPAWSGMEPLPPTPSP